MRILINDACVPWTTTPEIENLKGRYLIKVHASSSFICLSKDCQLSIKNGNQVKLDLII